MHHYDCWIPPQREPITLISEGQIGDPATRPSITIQFGSNAPVPEVIAKAWADYCAGRELDFVNWLANRSAAQQAAGEIFKQTGIIVGIAKAEKGSL